MLGGLAQSQPVGDDHKGPLINGKTPFLQNNKTQTSPHNHGPVQGGSHGPNNRSGSSSFHPRRPSGRSRLAQGLRAPSGRSPPRSRATRTLGRIPASLEGYPHPRADPRLARGLYTPPLERISVRKPRTHSPDRSIKRSNTPWAPESKVNPRTTAL
jgi:hypothetical protein